MFFLVRDDVKAELLGAYCSVLTTPVSEFPAESKQDEAKQDEPEQDKRGGSEMTRSLLRAVKEKAESQCGKGLGMACAFAATEFSMTVLKQASAARFYITLCEDLPQGALTVWLFALGKGNWFCVVSVLMSVARLVLTLPSVAKAIRRTRVRQLLQRRRLAIESQNSSGAIGVTEELARVDYDDFGAMTAAHRERLISMIATNGMKQLTGMAHNPHILVLLLAAAATDETGQASVRLRKNLDQLKVDVDVKRKLFQKLFQKGYDHMTLLHLAAQLGDIGCIHELTKRGADLEAEHDGYEHDITCTRSYTRWTPMHVAVFFGRVECISVLNNLGANVNAADGSDQTPMHWAARGGRVDIVLALMACGAEVINANYDWGYTPVHRAAYVGNVKIMTKFLDSGIPVNILSKKGQTLMHVAALSGSMECIEALLKHGLELNAPQDAQNNTPMHEAAGVANVALMRHLKTLGGKMDVPGRDGLTPLEVFNLRYAEKYAAEPPCI
eukprot:TRINITY_DN29941_c0_g2_i1.p1 TRINITY_DN29941_c0_g2~~TRINITY_DN29941_c0_g2_i1.p1  ORF type:complete len:499 (+),score=62.81 TRINITY_DN29941_c0_g2_i1:1276-2772(+)